MSKLDPRLVDQLRASMFEDSSAWLVFADWLTDHNDPRGLRIQRHESASPEALEDPTPEEEAARWLPGLQVPREVELCWRHGFVISATARVPWPLDFLHELFDHPSAVLLSNLSMEGWTGSEHGKTERIDALGRLLARGQLFALSVKGTRFGAPLVGALRQLRKPERLRYLDLDAAFLTNEGARALVEIPWRDLAWLNLDNNHLGDAGMEALGSLRLPRLLRLTLQGNPIGEPGAEHLVSGAFPKLLLLSLGDTYVPDEWQAKRRRFVDYTFSNRDLEFGPGPPLEQVPVGRRPCPDCYGLRFCHTCRGMWRYNNCEDCDDCANSGICWTCRGAGSVLPEPDE